ncbi:uncharacterized protein FOMMEDRAFT_151001 [Fomitiporia mediterranea MF3/22]|uniref:uncharacterized protein n=1 Tax=Fomitiporia mediterranea (strain MF3/22) TaxID=694068 RepID=UPI0004409B4C|nr:uncharacterized protein FOMMEDRAFT_151001 [Fomitiporia mediterranea MF3/22]EJD08261.1 hypothetical protein FOMMEDRAFT_151001 [Fomitiporia mediterranea MF3/22]
MTPTQSSTRYIRSFPLSNVPRLPTELLTEIFKLATDNPVRDIDSLVSRKPFEGIYASETEKACSAALCTKHALSLVCRSFRTLMIDLLYEDIWIRYGSDGLMEVLESSSAMDKKAGKEGQGFGRSVKRVSLSQIGNCGSSESLKNIRRILIRCPNVRIICQAQKFSSFPINEGEAVRNDFISCAPPVDDLDFPHLQRVEWFNARDDVTNAIAPMPSVLFNSESLRVLILGSNNFPAPRLSSRGQDQREKRDYRDLFDDSDAPETTISLPNLHTLSIQSIDTFGGLPRIYRLSLPSLEHLILQRPEAIYTFFNVALTPLATQVKSVEIAPDLRFLRKDFVSTILQYCDNAESVYIPVFYTKAPHRNEVPRVFLEFNHVKEVHLHASLPNGYAYGEEAWWAMLDAHFEGLCGGNSRFTVLERIVFAGKEWMESIRVCEMNNDEKLKGRFKRVVNVVTRRGVELVAEDRDVQAVLEVVIQDLNATDSSVASGTEYWQLHY